MFTSVHKGCFNQHGKAQRLRRRPRRGIAALPKDYQERARRALQEAGLDTPGFWDSLTAKVVNWGSEAVGGIKGVVRTAASHVGAQVVTRIAGALPTTVAGPAGLVLGQAVASSLDYFLPDGSETASAPRLSAIKARDWVAIDKGVHVLAGINEGTAGEVLQIASRDTLLGPVTDLGSPEYGMPKRELCLGFVVGPGPERGTWDVFCLTSAKVENARVEDLRAPTPQQLAFVNGSETAATVRDLFFVEGVVTSTLTPGATTAGLDPGSEVRHEGERWTVVEAVNDVALVEDARGTRKEVPAGELTRGRSDNDVTWNYQPDGSVTPSGFSDTAPYAVHRGRWVWAPPSGKALRALPRCEVMLGVVQRVEGSEACVYAAYDGSYVKLPCADVVPVDPELCRALDGMAALLRFRVAVAEAGVVRGLEVGTRSETLGLISLGVVDSFRAPGQRATAGQLRDRVDPGQRAQRTTRGEAVAAEEQKTGEAAPEGGVVTGRAQGTDLAEMLALANDVDPNGGLTDEAQRAARSKRGDLELAGGSAGGSNATIGLVLGAVALLYVFSMG